MTTPLTPKDLAVLRDLADNILGGTLLGILLDEHAEQRKALERVLEWEKSYGWLVPQRRDELRAAIADAPGVTEP